MTDNQNARLLDCGWCYEENGEECHPHPECPIGRVAAPEVQQGPPTLDTPRCVLCTHPKGDHSDRTDHTPSRIVPRRPWCHACDATCDYAEPRTAAPAVSSAVSATTTQADRVADRERVAETLAVADGWRFGNGIEFAHMSNALTGHYRGLADAVLAVLPPPADRAAIRAEAFREAAAATRRGAFADTFDRMAEQELRRLAAETAGPETQAEAGPTAEELAGHLAAQRISVLHGAFRILGWPPLQFELADDEATAPDTGDDHSCADSGCTGEPTAAGETEPTNIVDWPEVEYRTAQSGIDTPGCNCGHDGMGPGWHGPGCDWMSVSPCDTCGRRGHSFEDCPRADEPAVPSQPEETTPECVCTEDACPPYCPCHHAAPAAVQTEEADRG